MSYKLIEIKSVLLKSSFAVEFAYMNKTLSLKALTFVFAFECQTYLFKHFVFCSLCNWELFTSYTRTSQNVVFTCVKT